MSKKSSKAVSKGKEKKLARKAATEHAAALASKLRALEAGSACGADLAAQYPAFLRYHRNGLAAALRFFAAAELPPGVLDWALALTRTHMAALYEACPEWGWSDAKKRAELSHSSARHLVVFDDQLQQQQQGSTHADASHQATAPAAATTAAAPAATTEEAAASVVAVPAPAGQENSAAAGNGGEHAAASAAQQAQPEGQPLAFLHYRFEEEAGEAVLYCYEIQVAAAAQGKGLGRFLMQLLELMGRRAGVARLMLTVFRENAAAAALYRRLGYVLDDTSPGATDPTGDHKYEILTKRLQ